MLRTAFLDMRKFYLVAGLGLSAVIVGLGCGDSAGPSTVAGYDWSLIVTYDSAGPRMDTLSFHWPRSYLPVKIWVENQDELPTRVQEGIALWKTAFQSGEWDASIVADSTTADVIFRAAQPPPVLRAAGLGSTRWCLPASGLPTFRPVPPGSSWQNRSMRTSFPAFLMIRTLPPASEPWPPMSWVTPWGCSSTRPTPSI